MKRFIYHILLFFLPIPLFFVLIGFCADGYTDPFYIRLTTPKQQNLIIGTSRAAQGLQPKYFKEILDVNIFNYAFTIAHSPFGNVYYESIKKKLNKNTKDGIFIITVDPWSISSWCDNPNDFNSFRENNLCLANTKIVDMYPNYEYLYKNLKGNYKSILFPPSKNMFLHSDGWLEIKNIPMDSISKEKRINLKIKTYKNTHLPKTHISEYRLNYLLQTILYLKQYGKVYLVRLPIHPEMLKLENEITNDFNSIIKSAINKSDGYLDLTPYNNKFQYTDGNHLYKNSGKKVSVIIANWINGDKVRTPNNAYKALGNRRLN